MKVILTVLAVCAVGCAGASNGSSGTQTSSEPWADTAMQELVADKCATSSCHGGPQRPSFANISESAMRANTEALSEVQAGKMPKSGSLTAAERATFLAFYGQ